MLIETDLIQAKKIMEHNRKYERKREEKEIKARKERMRKAKEEYERAKAVRTILYSRSFLGFLFHHLY